MMIGLKRHTVRLEPHNTAWHEFYNEESKRIKEILGENIADIQHVGSTAVPGLIAKPIIDIAMRIDSKLYLKSIIEKLTGFGYIDRGDGGNNGGYLLIKESMPDIRIIHLHIVETTDPQWTEYIAFRDILTQDENIKTEYANLKSSLAIKFKDDRLSYTESKDKFIKTILKKIQT